MARTHLTIPAIFQVDFPGHLQTKLNEHDTALDEIEAVIADVSQGSGLEDGAITTGKIHDAAVTTSKIANGAVTTDKIDTGAVDQTKLATGAALANLAAMSITTDKIATGAVTNTQLANGAAAANLGGASGAHGVSQQTAAGSGSPINVDSTTTGGTGATAYTVADVVLRLKSAGLLAA